MKFKPAKLADIFAIFRQIDDVLSQSSIRIRVKILGGASILLLGLRQRVTIDIDVAITPDAAEFQKICKKMGIPVDIVTVTTTVDLAYCSTITVFQGKSLVVDSVTPRDLLKLKLERFYKQDPEDIYAIIAHEAMTFDEFVAIAKDMVIDYIGNVRQLILSAQIVVEQIWPNRVDEFKKMGWPL